MNKIELVAGQWYLNRSGAIVYTAFDKRNIMPGIKHAYPIVALDTEGVEISFTSDGVFYKGSLGSSGQDLVEHLPDCTGFDYVKPTAKVLERVPVRLWKVAHNKEVYVFSKDFHPGIHYEEIKYDESGFYLEQ